MPLGGLSVYVSGPTLDVTTLSALPAVVAVRCSPSVLL
ncbi:MAG: hypothetical protein AVDCRST_MAG52-502 [uncultured Blastococcus sp.]|uniref:Uncharacterized protein n=1 Tax=uncultured Blastococcus sp. TaxID=217144 RepID=A0A6J4HG87_9ACTN|nr:MAG: hypothetical protein AVDCRST_MAG52-502 [uncultured Blastococcus sp.]